MIFMYIQMTFSIKILGKSPDQTCNSKLVEHFASVENITFMITDARANHRVDYESARKSITI